MPKTQLMKLYLLNNFIKIYRKYTTLCFKLKYGGVVCCDKNVVVEERVKVRRLSNSMRSK